MPTSTPSSSADDDHDGPRPTTNTLRPSPDERPDLSPLPPAEEAGLLAQSGAHKARANALFAAAAYADALHLYAAALGALPAYRAFEAAVLRANMAACQLKLGAWQAAAAAATEALDALERVDPPPRRPGAGAGAGAGAVEELDEETAARMEAFARGGGRVADVRRIRAKALLRRARARVELGGWAALQGADEGVCVCV